jgi:hypothetical protein
MTAAADDADGWSMCTSPRLHPPSSIATTGTARSHGLASGVATASTATPGLDGLGVGDVDLTAD